MALHSSTLSDRQRQLVPNRMMYPIEPSGLLGTSKIMQYKSPDFGSLFDGDSGNNVVRFTVNGPGLLDPRSLYIRYSMQNATVSGADDAANALVKCDPGSYSAFKRVRILSGFNQQVLYDNDGYNVMCAFLDDYLKDVHDLTCDGHGFYGVNTVGTVGGAAAATEDDTISNEFVDWSFKPQFSAVGDNAGMAWKKGQKLVTITDMPYVGLFTQGKYIPLWGLGGIIIEIYLDNAASWCSVPAASAGIPRVSFTDFQLYYDNVVPPADFLEGMKNQINSPEGLSMIFPSVNRHLATLSDVSGSVFYPQYTTSTRQELLVADHSRMAQAIYQIFRPQQLISDKYRPYKLHNRTSACLSQWQLKLNSAYIPQQPLVAQSKDSADAAGLAQDVSSVKSKFELLAGRQYGQFYKELMKALGQQSRPLGSVTPTTYELLTDVKNAPGAAVEAPHACSVAEWGTSLDRVRGHRGSFAIGVDLTVSDDVMTGTNLRNATVTGEMFAIIDRYVHPSATATEVQTYVFKLSQIRLTSAGPIVID